MLDNTKVLMALRNRLLGTSGIPATNYRALINKPFEPVKGTPYIAEEYVPAPTQLKTITVDTGTVEARGLYIVKWFGIQKTGITAIYTGVDAVLARFSSGTRIALSNGDVVRIAGVPIGPSAGPIINTDDGFAVSVITSPWYLFTANAIAA